MNNPDAEFNLKAFVMARQSIAWYKEHREEWESTPLRKDVPRLLSVANAQESPADKNKGETGEGAGMDEGADDAAGEAVGDAEVKVVLEPDDASSSADAVVIDKGKGRARSEDMGNADGNEDDGEGDADEDEDDKAPLGLKTRRTITYDPHDLRVSKNVTILPVDTPPKYPGPRPLCMSATKAEPVDRLSVVSNSSFLVVLC
jgi:hypothetical protein